MVKLSLAVGLATWRYATIRRHGRRNKSRRGQVGVLLRRTSDISRLTRSLRHVMFNLGKSRRLDSHTRNIGCRRARTQEAVSRRMVMHNVYLFRGAVRYFFRRHIAVQWIHRFGFNATRVSKHEGRVRQEGVDTYHSSVHSFHSPFGCVVGQPVS